MDPQVLIIGGGVIGLSIARELHKRGVTRITIVEKGLCGTESSWAAGGMLGPQAEADERDTFFDFCSESRDLYPTFAAELLDETGIDIELDRTGTIYLAFSDADAAHLLKRYRWQRDAGLAVETLSQEDIIRAEPKVSAVVQMGLFFANDWQVENRRLCAALKRYAELNGIEIRENTAVDNVIIENGRVTGVETSSGSLSADTTVLATGAWTSLIKLGQGEMPLKLEPVKGQMICFRPEGKPVAHVIYTPRGYVVPRRDGRVLAGSTSEHTGFEKGVTREAADRLAEMATEISPSFGALDISDSWSGLRPFAADGLPILGTTEELAGLVFATGHYRNGILLAPRTAEVIAELILKGRQSRYLEQFGPERFRRAAARG